MEYRQFPTGATRDTDNEKFDYEAFLSPLVLYRYGQFMHSKRKMPDGTTRSGDNWQKGIPLPEYIKSLYRHMVNLHLHIDGYGDLATEDIQTTFCAIMFNAMGGLFETMKGERKTYADPSSPLLEIPDGCNTTP